MLLLAAILAVTACSDRSSFDDARPPVSDSGPQPDGLGKLYPCNTPGRACEAHDPCAVDPVCGDDLLCRPRMRQNCDDNLACTTDICAGQGRCDHEPAEGSCVLPVKGADGKTVLQCFASGAQAPDKQCRTCDPTQSQTEWSWSTGGACDDDDACTRDDYCDNGTCKGTYYGEQCQDDYACTEDACDGNGGCLGNALMSGWCLINGGCFQDKEPDATGCNVCDVAQSVNAWTSLGAHCLIGGTCYKPGDKDPTQCGVCDPANNDAGWTPLPGLCQIDGACYKKNDTNTAQGGCGRCDPDVDPTVWQVDGDDCLISGSCYKPNDKDPIGCGQCTPSQSKTAWTPIPNCYAILMTALNEAHKGNLGGIAGADALCAAQATAAGRPGTFRAFLSSSTQNVKDLVTGVDAMTIKVVNTKGEILYNSWNQIFTTTKWASPYYLYSFNGTQVDEGKTTPDWNDADGWNGSDMTGAVKAGFTCNDWTADTSAHKGANGELDFRELLKNETATCDKTLAVVCVQVGL